MSATIAPGKVDGSHWDGVGRVPDAVWSALRNALASVTPYAALAPVLLQLANEGWDKPDVRGAVELLGQPGARVLSKIPDSYQPSWTVPVSFVHVPTDPRVRFRVHLADVDVMNDDPIGTVELSMPMLYAAITAGRVYQVRVDDQSPQVLFVGVSVRPE